MTNDRPKISIVIPTFNRAEYLRYTLETCVAQSYDKVEFIVQDDASTDCTFQVVDEFASADSRIRYLNTGTNAGMRGNFEQAVNAAKGDYLICLGSDDALLPGALDELSGFIREFPDDLITWPTASFHYSAARAGKSQLMIPHSISQRPFKNKLKTRDYFHRQVDRLFYADDHLAPMLYVKSCVPLSLLRRATEISGGKFFLSSTPDGYSSFAIASLIDNYIYTNVCFTLHGVSPSSAGLNYVNGKGGAEDHSKKFFQDHKSVPMAPQLAAAPYSPLIALMTADFIYQTDNIFSHGHSQRISVDKLIRKSLAELADGLFAPLKIKRELDIIFEIAKFHNKEATFECELSKSRRNSRRILTGDAISPSLTYLDGGRWGLKNVNDAAKFVKTHRNSRRIYAKLNPIEAIANAVGYKIQSYKLREPLADYF